MCKINTITQQSVCCTFCVLNVRWVQDTKFQENTSTGSSDTARWFIVMPVKCTWSLFEHNQYTQHVGYVCGETGVGFQEDSFPVSCWRIKKLTLVLGEKCEMKTVSSQEFTSIRSQDKKKQFAFLFQWFGLNYWPIEIKRLIRIFSKIPTILGHIFLHVVDFNYLQITTIFAFLCRCRSRKNYEFLLISLHWNQRYRQNIHYSYSELHSICGWLQPQLHCL